jgi:hypothetical protein
MVSRFASSTPFRIIFPYHIPFRNIILIFLLIP